MYETMKQVTKIYVFYIDYTYYIPYYIYFSDYSYKGNLHCYAFC